MSSVSSLLPMMSLELLFLSWQHLMLKSKFLHFNLLHVLLADLLSCRVLFLKPQQRKLVLVVSYYNIVLDIMSRYNQSYTSVMRLYVSKIVTITIYLHMVYYYFGSLVFKFYLITDKQSLKEKTSFYTMITEESLTH